MPAVVLGHHLLNLNRSMTLITFQDGKPVFRDGKVGTEQECCCQQGCPCSLCDEDLISVVIEGQELLLSATDFGSLEFCFVDEDPADCTQGPCDKPEPCKMASSRGAFVYTDCYDDPGWEFLKETIGGLEDAWPSSGIVIHVALSAGSNSDANRCVDVRDIFYNLTCDAEGCPSDAEEFFRRNVVVTDDCPEPVCEETFDLSCVGISDPTFVGVNQLP